MYACVCMHALFHSECVAWLFICLDKAAAESLAQKVDDAAVVLKEYNKRLENELKERGEVQELLDAFIWQQKSLLRIAKKNLKEYQARMEQVIAVKEELKSHLANLPDFSQLPVRGRKNEQV